MSRNSRQNIDITSLRHLKWTRQGRKLELSTGQRVYKALIGQQNIELYDGSFAPYVWNNDSRILRYADVEARFVKDKIEFWHANTLQAITTPKLQRKTFRGWVDEDANVRIEKLTDEDNFGAIVNARVAVTIESKNATAKHILVAGCRPRARADTELIAHLPGEYRVVIHHELNSSPQKFNRGAIEYISCSDWRVAWTLEEELDRNVNIAGNNLIIELPSIRRYKGQKKPAEQRISPDTYGPVLNAGGGNDCIADEDGVLLNGPGAGAGTYQYWLGVDENDDIMDVCALRFGSVDLTGATAITSASLFNDRGGVNRNQGTNTVRTRCQQSNTPTTPTGNIAVGENPRTRTYLAAFSDNSVPASTADLTLDVTTATQGCLTAGYSYTGNSSHAIFYGIGGNQMFGIATVSWSHIAWDEQHPTSDPASLEIVFEVAVESISSTISNNAEFNSSILANAFGTANITNVANVSVSITGIITIIVDIDSETICDANITAVGLISAEINNIVTFIPVFDLFVQINNISTVSADISALGYAASNIEAINTVFGSIQSPIVGTTTIIGQANVNSSIIGIFSATSNTVGQASINSSIIGLLESSAQLFTSTTIIAIPNIYTLINAVTTFNANINGGINGSLIVDAGATINEVNMVGIGSIFTVINGVSDCSASVIEPLSAFLTGMSSVDAESIGIGDVISSIDCAADVDGQLNGSGEISAQINGLAAVSATPSVTSVIISETVINANLSALGNLLSQINGATDVNIILQGIINIDAAIDCLSELIGTLSVDTFLHGTSSIAAQLHAIGDIGASVSSHASLIPNLKGLIYIDSSVETDSTITAHLSALAVYNIEIIGSSTYNITNINGIYNISVVIACTSGLAINRVNIQTVISCNSLISGKIFNYLQDKQILFVDNLNKSNLLPGLIYNQPIIKIRKILPPQPPLPPPPPIPSKINPLQDTGIKLNNIQSPVIFSTYRTNSHVVKTPSITKSNNRL